MKSPKAIILWIIFLFLVLIGTTWALLNVKYTRQVNCDKAMAIWNYDEGQAAIAAFGGNDKKASVLKTQYEKLVSDQPECFPPDLVDYVKQHG